nr:hypothetical protein [Shuttleworthia satelles]
MTDIRYNLVDDWQKKELDLQTLEQALENGSAGPYTDRVFSSIGGKWKKYSKRGVSNLYLLKEMEDDGLVCAYYAYSIRDGVIGEDILAKIRSVCAESLGGGEMYAKCSDSSPDHWLDTNPEFLTKLVSQGKADLLYEYLNAELYSEGIVLTSRGMKGRKKDRLAASAVAWGVKDKGLFNKGSYYSVLINNDVL